MSTDQTPATTTNAGAPVHSDEHSMTVGAAGPLLLQDHYLIEKMAQFNRERVPERVVHAKGGGAFGRFTVTDDVSHLTMAKVFQPGAETETLLRFSSVAGEQGSPDTWRDPRGFSVKFYTEDGNYDLVGNNTPVFFVRDPMKFQDFIRSQKRDPQTGLRDHDMQWDFWSLSPESAHQVTWLMGDRGLPKSWRTMNGYGSHTFMWINADGVRSWVKYHFKTDQGHEFFTQDEGDAMAGQDGDFHRRDLLQAIEDGNYPTWSLKVQVIPFEDAAGYRFNPFDVTKTVSQKDYPLIDVGTLELNRNPAHYHVDIEQAAFEPSNFVPGIGPSPDRMLVGRLFSYADAHRYRIGANYNQLPSNAPRATTVHSYSKDGAMRFQHDGDAPVYAPNSRGGAAADPAKAGPTAGWDAAGSMTREAETLHAEDDDFGQARTLLMEVFDDAARERFLTNVTGHLLNAVSEPVLQRAFQYWRNVDEGMGTRIENVVRGALAGGDGGAPEPGDGVTGPSGNVNADADEVDVRDRAGMA